MCCKSTVFGFTICDQVVHAGNVCDDMQERQRRIDRIVEPDTQPVEAEQSTAVRRIRKPSPTTVHKWLSRVDGRFMGEPIDIHPHEAILQAMRIAAGEVVYCDAQIRRLEEDELFERPLKTTVVELPSGALGEVTEVRDFEQISRWVRWRTNAMRNMATYAKMALDVGIEERQIQLAEQQAQQLVTVISAVLTDLGHDLKDIRTREIVRRRLMEGAIEGSGVPVSGESNAAA